MSQFGLRATRASDTRCGALSSECGTRLTCLTCLTCLTDLVCRRYIKSATPARSMREYRRPQGEKRRATPIKVSNPIFWRHTCRCELTAAYRCRRQKTAYLSSYKISPTGVFLKSILPWKSLFFRILPWNVALCGTSWPDLRHPHFGEEMGKIRTSRGKNGEDFQYQSANLQTGIKPSSLSIWRL